jgi:hypothetical protein
MLRSLRLDWRKGREGRYFCETMFHRKEASRVGCNANAVSKDRHIHKRAFVAREIVCYIR